MVFMKINDNLCLLRYLKRGSTINTEKEKKSKSKLSRLDRGSRKTHSRVDIILSFTDLRFFRE